MVPFSEESAFSLLQLHYQEALFGRLLQHAYFKRITMKQMAPRQSLRQVPQLFSGKRSIW
jgi:hypothetical protein